MSRMLQRARRAALNVYSKYLAWSAQRQATRFLNSLVAKEPRK